MTAPIDPSQSRRAVTADVKRVMPREGANPGPRHPTGTPGVYFETSPQSARNTQRTSVLSQEAVIVGPVPAGALNATPITGTRSRLHLPYTRPPAALTGNTRAHWRLRSADTRQVRGDVLRLAHNANLHRFTGLVDHVTVELTWAPGDRRRRDADNLWPLLKALSKNLAEWYCLACR